MTNYIYIENLIETSTRNWCIVYFASFRLSITRACTFTPTEGHAQLPLYTAFARDFAVLHWQIAISGKSREIMGGVVYRSWSGVGHNLL